MSSTEKDSQYTKVVDALRDAQQALANAIHTAGPAVSASSSIAWKFAEDKARKVLGEEREKAPDRPVGLQTSGTGVPQENFIEVFYIVESFRRQWRLPDQPEHPNGEMIWPGLDGEDDCVDHWASEIAVPFTRWTEKNVDWDRNSEVVMVLYQESFAASYLELFGYNLGSLQDQNNCALLASKLGLPVKQLTPAPPQSVPHKAMRKRGR